MGVMLTSKARSQAVIQLPHGPLSVGAITCGLTIHTYHHLVRKHKPHERLEAVLTAFGTSQLSQQQPPGNCQCALLISVLSC